MTELVHHLLAHLVKSLMLSIRYGLIALFISSGVGVGCRKWPLIHKQAAEVVDEIDVAKGVETHQVAGCSKSEYGGK